MSPAYSQDTIDFATANSKTLQYTNAAKWDSVIYYGNIALKNNIDYFYLRVRLGMAYYNKQNYTKSISEFEKAIKFNSSDTYAQEMHYYSYVLAGRESDAQYLFSSFTETEKNNLGVKKSGFLSSLYFESGISLSDNFKKNEKTNFPGNEKIYGEADLNGNITYGHLGLKHNIGKRFSVYHSFQVLNLGKEKIIENTIYRPNGINITEFDTSYYVPPPPAGGHYNFDTIITHSVRIGPFDTTVTYKNNLSQLEYYINCNVLLTKGLILTPFFHLINVRYQLQKAVSQLYNINTTDTFYTHTQIVVPNPFPPPMYIVKDTLFIDTNNYSVGLKKYNYLLSDTSFSNYVYGFALSKRIGNFNIGLFGSASNLNGLKQQEAGIYITWFPGGNLNLYFNSTLTAFKEKSRKNIVFNQMAGTKVLKNLWLEGFVTVGDINGFSEDNGFIIHNNPDFIKFRIGLTPMIIFKKFDIIIRYQYQAKQGSYFFQNESGVMTEGTIDYRNHLITGGVKWRF